MATKNEEIINPGSCWNKAEDTEPLFVLRANDEKAPEIVILWAQKYLTDKGGLRKMSDAQTAKYYEAIRAAQKMREWKTRKLAQTLGSDDDIPF